MGMNMIYLAKCKLAQKCAIVTPRYFWSEVHANASLMAQLESLGYNRKTRTLTVRQAEVIAAYYGVDLYDDDNSSNTKTTASWPARD